MTVLPSLPGRRRVVLLPPSGVLRDSAKDTGRSKIRRQSAQAWACCLRAPPHQETQKLGQEVVDGDPAGWTCPRGGGTPRLDPSDPPHALLDLLTGSLSPPSPHRLK